MWEKLKIHSDNNPRCPFYHLHISQDITIKRQRGWSLFWGSPTIEGFRYRTGKAVVLASNSNVWTIHNLLNSRSQNLVKNPHSIRNGLTARNSICLRGRSSARRSKSWSLRLRTILTPLKLADVINGTAPFPSYRDEQWWTSEWPNKPYLLRME